MVTKGVPVFFLSLAHLVKLGCPALEHALFHRGKAVIRDPSPTFPALLFVHLELAPTAEGKFSDFSVLFVEETFGRSAPKF